MSIVTALAISFIVVLLSAVVATQVIHAGQQTGMDRSRAQAFHVAEAGIHHTFGKLSVDPNVTGDSGSVVAGSNQVGTYATTVTAPDTYTRIVRSTGTAAGQTRIIKETVRLQALGGFNYALFSATTMSLNNHLTVTGSTYSANATTLQNYTTTVGDVISPSNITTGNNSIINGNVWSGGNVSIANGTTVNGNVTASGNVTIYGTVNGDVYAQSITPSGGTIKGNQVTGVTMPAPPTLGLPTFTYVASQWPGVQNVTGAGLASLWSGNDDHMSGTYYVTDGATVNGPNHTTTLNGDFTIITSGQVNISRDFAASGAGPYSLRVISTCSACSPAISWTNNVTPPPSIKIFFFATGPVTFNNLKTFQGLVYASNITQDQNFTINYDTGAVPTNGSFTWSLSSAAQWIIVPGLWQECNATAGNC